MQLEKRGQLFLVPHFDIPKRTKCHASCFSVWQNDISHPIWRFFIFYEDSMEVVNP